MKRRMLLTGFEPFTGFRVNSSWEAICDLDGTESGRSRLFARCLPVSYRRAGPALKKALRETRPSIVVAFGLYGGSRVRLENVAINIDHASPKRPDNDGFAPQGRRIAPGALALPSKLPLQKLGRRLEAAGVPVRHSFSAGTYLCNHVFYLLARRRGIAGFIHVPPLKSKRHPKGWTLPRLRRTVREIVRAL